MSVWGRAGQQGRQCSPGVEPVALLSELPQNAHTVGTGPTRYGTPTMSPNPQDRTGPLQLYALRTGGVRNSVPVGWGHGLCGEDVHSRSWD